MTTVRRRTFLAAGGLGLLGWPAIAQRRGPRGGRVESLPQANDEAEKRVLGVLDAMQKGNGLYLSVNVTDGRMMRLLTECSGAKSVVEIGTSTGFSGLWFCLALQKTGGRLSTFELDHGRATTARENFHKAGVESLVNITEGDAHENVSRLKGPVDVVFIDADKEGYPDYLKKLLPLTRPGGLILAHNINSSEEYDRQIVSNPALETIFYMDGGGLGITMKKV